MKTFYHFLLKGMAFIACIASLFLVHSCDYDDSDLWDAVNGLDGRVQELEEIARTVQSDLNSIRTIVDKMQQKITVDSIVANGDDSYTIRFSDGTSVTIVNNIEDILPPAVIVMEEDGRYWWGYRFPDGHAEFITDGNGKRIPVSAEAPQVRINPENNHWEISVDGGRTWSDTGVDAAGNGEKLIAEITEDEDYYYLVLTNGGTIRIAKTQQMEFRFDCEKELSFKFGETKRFGYVARGVVNTTVSKPDGWKVVLSEQEIEITAPVVENEFAETAGKIQVVAFGCKGQSAFAEIEVNAKLPEVRLQIQWTQGDKFFTDLHFGTAEEAGAEDLKPANCFLVRPGRTYRFRTNIMGRGAEGVAALGLNEEVNTLGDFTVRRDAAISDLLNFEQYEYVYFTTCNEGTAEFGGNGVFSIVIDGRVVWTWHVWARAEDPEIEVIGSVRQMSVNLGSWGPELIRVKILHNYRDMPFVYWYGLPYSWGFNVPYPGLTSYNMAMTMSGVTESKMYYVYRYDENNMPYGNTDSFQASERIGSSSDGLEASVGHPLNLANLTGADAYDAMWGGAAHEKTIFDPCPYGYRVADRSLFDAYDFGMLGYGGLNYNKEGGRNRLNFGGILSLNKETNLACYYDETRIGYYWLSTSDSERGKGDLFCIKGSKDMSVSAFERGNGALVRCVKYDKEQ